VRDGTNRSRTADSVVRNEYDFNKKYDFRALSNGILLCSR